MPRSHTYKHIQTHASVSLIKNNSVPRILQSIRKILTIDLWALVNLLCICKMQYIAGMKPWNEIEEIKLTCASQIHNFIFESTFATMKQYRTTLAVLSQFRLGELIIFAAQGYQRADTV